MRHWIFTSSKVLLDNECAVVTTKMHSFLSTWLSHGAPVDATFKLVLTCILIVELHEHASSSGCSTDSLFRCIKLLETELQCEWLNRKYVVLQHENTHQVMHADAIPKNIPLSALKAFHVLDANAYSANTQALPWISADTSWLKSLY